VPGTPGSAWHVNSCFRRIARVLIATLGAVLLVVGCGAPAPSPTPTLTPSPAPSPTPSPTPTPLPPVPLTIRFPETVSALEGVTVTVELPGLAQRDPQARVWARVFRPSVGDPVWKWEPEVQGWAQDGPPGVYMLVWESLLERAGNGAYVSPQPVYFSLEVVPGDWYLFVDIQSPVPARGGRWFRFRQEPVPFWDLAGQVPGEVSLPVPQPFIPIQQEGDLVAGGRVWQRGGERIELWWAPGPAKPLTLDTAQMLVEATFPIGETVEISSVETITRGKRPGFLFREQWSDGPAEALLLQSSSRYLYLLRVRVWGPGELTPLLREIQAAMQVR